MIPNIFIQAPHIRCTDSGRNATILKVGSRPKIMITSVNNLRDFACLKNIKFTFLDCEFDIARKTKMMLNFSKNFTILTNLRFFEHAILLVEFNFIRVPIVQVFIGFLSAGD